MHHCGTCGVMLDVWLVPIMCAVMVPFAWLLLVVRDRIAGR